MSGFRRTFWLGVGGVALIGAAVTILTLARPGWALPVGPGGVQGSISGTTPSCPHTLEFDQACNSQYLNVVGI